jgi:hypothetical protein
MSLHYHRCQKFISTQEKYNRWVEPKMESDLTFESIMRSDRTYFAMKERWID